MNRTLYTSISLGFLMGSLAMTTDANQTAELETRHWQLLQFLNESEDARALPDISLIDMRLSGGKFSGVAGCNSYFGSYSTQGEKLAFAQPIGTTMKICPEPVMERERAYLQLLGLVTSYHVDDETLVMLDQLQQPVLKFGIQQPAELEKTQWQAAAINNGRGGVVSSASTELTDAQFADGKLTGNGGCNHYSAGYTLDQNRITIGPVMTTRKHCQEPEDIMQQEQEYLQAITGTRIFTLGTSSLELRDEQGALQARFSIKLDADDPAKQDRPQP